MTNPKRKDVRLALRRETLRQLSDMELARAAGGGPVVQYGTGEETCPTSKMNAVTSIGCG